MKRISLIIIFVFIMLLSFSVSAISKGDVDGNGKVGSTDYVLVRKHILKQTTLTGDKLTRADMNGDGKVTSMDYIAIRKIIINGNDATPTPTPKVTGKIHFLYVGDGDSIVLEADGHYGIVDTGYNYANQSKAHSDIIDPVAYLQSIGANHLDFVLATHGHTDHIGGMLSVVNSSMVDSNTTFYYRDTSENVSLMESIKGAFTNKGSKLINMSESNNIQNKNKFTLGSNNNKFSIELMNLNGITADETGAGENKNSMVIYLTYNGSHGTLLAGDMESQDEYRIANNNELSGKTIEVLKVPHHGWQSSMTMKFVKLSQIKPQIAVITNSRVLDDTSTAIYYLQQKHNTSFYVTGDNRSGKAVIVEYNDKLSVRTASGNAKKLSTYTTTNVGGNWRKLQNGMYFYLDDANNIDSIAADKFISDNGSWYYVGIGGNMMTGWIETKYNGKAHMFFLKADGKMVTGWYQPNSAIVPFNNGSLYKTDKYFEYNTGMYSHENDLVKGWYVDNGTWANGKNWFYFDTDGTMSLGWKQLDYKGTKRWFYFLPGDGRMVSNKTITIDGKSYKFNSDGVCISDGC